MSSSQRLIETVELLQQLGDIAQEMLTSQRNYDFAKIKELCAQNLELRPKLAEVNDRLRGFEPQTDDEREIIRLTGPILKKIRDADRVFTIWRSNLEMMRALGAKMAGQAFQNIHALCESPSFDILDGILAGVPAVVVAAGPSLDKNFHLLESVKDRAVIITMNRCAKLFQEAGITPHILIATDGNALLPERHLEGVGTEVLENLLCRFSVHPKMKDIPRGRTFLFTDGAAHEWRMMERLGMTTRPIGGGTVAHSCFQTAYYMGCDPIIIIGQDLAYEGDRVYSSKDVDQDQRLLVDVDGEVGVFTGGRQADGSAREGEITKGFRLRQVPGWHGTPVTTNRGFARHIEYFEALVEFNMSDRTIINATEGGAFLQGMEHIPFAQAIEAHIGDAEHDAFKRIAEVHAAYEPMLSKEEVAAEIRKVAQAMTRLERLARECKKLAASPRRDAKTVKRVKKKHAELRKAFAITEFLLQDVYRSIQSQLKVPDNQWDLLVQEFESIRQACKLLLPASRQAVEGLDA